MPARSLPPTGWIVVSAAWIALFAAWVTLRLGGTEATQVFDDLAATATPIAGGLGCAWAARRMSGRRRWAWGLLAAGAWSWAVGNGIWSFYELVLHRQTPPVSAADGGYLMAAIFSIAGLLLLPAPRHRPLALRAILDGLILGAIGLGISWNLVGETILQSAGGGTFAAAVNLAYPVLDVVVLVAAVYAATYSTRWARPIIATIAAGWVCNAVADSSYAYTSAIGSYETVRVLDIGWVAGFTLAGLAGLMATRAAWPMPISDARPASATLIVYGAVALAILVVILHPGDNSRFSVQHSVAILVVSLLTVRELLRTLDNRRVDSERAAAVEALRASEARLQTLISQAPVVIFALDAGGTITLARGSGVPNVEEAVGYNLSDMTEHPLHPLFSGALAGQETAGEVMVRGRLLEVRCQPVRDGGAVTGVIGVAVDITDRRAAERAKRESEAKDRFLANMSHELRTPLNSILGFAQMLDLEQDGPLGERRRRYQGHILSSGRQLLDLINEILDLAKVGAGRLDIEAVAAAVAPVVDEALATIRPQADSAGLSVEVEMAEGITVLADVGRLRQVLLNLLSNAVKFTPRGGAITVRARAVEDAVRLEVADTGLGIAPGDLERIFEEFTQLDTRRDRSVQGTGLGLALSRHLVRLMGGDLTVTSAPGEGSTFVVRLRAASAGGELPDQVGEPAEAFAEVGVGAGQADAHSALGDLAEGGAGRHADVALAEQPEREVAS